MEHTANDTRDAGRVDVHVIELGELSGNLGCEAGRKRVGDLLDDVSSSGECYILVSGL